MADSRFPTLRPFFTFPSFLDEEEWSSSVNSQGLEVYETENEVVVKAAVPGIPAENIEVTFEDGVLRIRGRYQENEEEKKKKKVVYQSQMVTSFDYATTLRRAINSEKIDAHINNGVITVTAPLAEASKPRRIAVKTNK